MAKFLLVALVVAAGLWLLRAHRRRHDRTPPPAAPAEDMVRCAHCGINLPRGESVTAGARQFCSDAHRQQFREPG